MRQYTDLRLDEISSLSEMVEIENEYQLAKWGVQTHSAFEWLAYLTEEVGELAQAISEFEYRDGNRDRVVKESIQVATLALKVAEMFNAPDDAERGGSK